MPTTPSRLVTVVALAFVVMAAPGCARSPGPVAHLSPKRSAAVVGLPVGVVNATAVPTAVPNEASSRRDVAISSCQAAPTGWKASGTAANPDNRRRRYLITVFFTTTAGTVIGSGQTAVTVASHAQQRWRVTATFHAAPDTRCVLVGVG